MPLSRKIQSEWQIFYNIVFRKITAITMTTKESRTKWSPVTEVIFRWLIYKKHEEQI